MLTEEQGSSTKLDKGKLRYDLVPFDALDEIVGVLTDGEIKYPSEGDLNWEKTPENEIKFYKAALLRHMSKIMQGEVIDPDSNRRHMAHIGSNALIILALELRFNKQKGMSNDCLN
jgi:hypothetical protein